MVILSPILFTGSFSNFIIQSAYAQSDLLIDLDGIISKLRGGAAFQDVFPGAPLTPFPPPSFPPPGSLVGIDFFDQTNIGTFDPGDDLHAEDSDNCPTAILGPPSSRDGTHNAGIDCVILDDPALGFPLVDGRVVDCDLETGGSPSGVYTFPCMIPGLTFYDKNGNMFYDLGEDIVLDVDGDGVFDPEPRPVGGVLLSIDYTLVLIGGVQTTFFWLIPALVSAIGFGLVLSRKI